MSIYESKFTKTVRTPRLPKVALIGAGSIGMLFFHRLAASKLVEPFFVDPRLRFSKSRSLKLVSSTISYRPALELPVKGLRYAQAIIITTKAFDTIKVCQQITKDLPNNIPVIVAANGLGAVNDAIKVLKAHHPVLAAVTANGAMKKGNSCFHKGNGPTYIGPSLNLAANYQPLSHNYSHQKLLTKIIVALSGSMVSNADPYILAKLSANAVINPLTALHHCCNGELDKHLPEILNICEEIYPILKSMGLNITPKELITQIQKICHATAGNYSSMEQDFEHHRRTETDYILKPLIKAAQHQGLKHSLISSIYDQISYKYEGN